jgi:uncharacterized protein (DUF1501 family)
LGESSCAAVSGVAVLNTLVNLHLAQRASAQGAPTDHKTLVCLFLNGGNDSFNWLVPRDAGRHAVYRGSRGNLALGLESLLPLNQTAQGDGQWYGIHPSCAGLQELFNGLGGDTGKRRAAFVTNVGTLVEPTTKAGYLAETAWLPRALFSHSDQIDQWQTGVPQGMSELTGWGGRAADVLHGTANTGQTAMGISLAGNNLFQVGNTARQFVITEEGALTLTGPSTDAASDPLNPLRLKNAAQKSVIEQHYAGLMAESFAQLTRTSLEAQAFFLEQFNGHDDSAVAGLFPEGSFLARQFRAAAKVIALRPQLGLRRQTLYLSLGGWDHHGELLETQAGMLTGLSAALTAFQKALEALGLEDTVVTFTASDFGRTLRSNGRGTDHAWGGNALVMGGPVLGGRVHGTFPDLALDGPDDAGYGGRLVPSLSVDAFFGEMLDWFGVPAGSMELVLPNVGNFYSPAATRRPVGFLAA